MLQEHKYNLNRKNDIMEKYNKYHESLNIDCCDKEINKPKVKKVSATSLPENERKIIKIGNTGDEIFLTGNLFSSFQNVNNTYVNISGVSKIYSGGNVNIGSSTPIVSNVVPYKQGEEAHFW